MAYDSDLKPGGEMSSESSPSPRRLRVWGVWLAVLFGIILLMLFKERMEVPGEILSQHQFETLVDSGRIVLATINYDNQSLLNEITGKYLKIENDRKLEVPFRTRVRLSASLEGKLLSLPQFEPRQPNTALLNLVWSVLPIVVIAILIWFFFIRQIRKIARSSSSTSDLQARTSQQQDRLDRILDKWERQAARMDAILDRMEQGRGLKQ